MDDSKAPMKPAKHELQSQKGVLVMPGGVGTV